MKSIGGQIFVTINTKLDLYLEHFYSVLSGASENVARIVLILYIVIVGYRLIMGKCGEAKNQAIVAIIGVPLMYAVAFDSTLYMHWIVDPVNSFAMRMMALFINGNTTSSVPDMFTRLDGVFSRIFDAISAASGNISGWDVGMQIKVALVQIALSLTFGFLYVIFFVLLILGFFALHVFFVVGVIPLFLGAFPDTRHVMWAWVKAIANYALIPVFTAIVMSITLYFLDTAVSYIELTNVTKNGIFTAPIGYALFVGIMSIYFHLKAPEFAAALTGGQASGVGGFLGTVAGIGAGTAMAANKLGLTGAARGVGGWAGGAGRNALSSLDNRFGGHAGNAYRQIKGLAE